MVVAVYQAGIVAIGYELKERLTGAEIPDAGQDVHEEDQVEEELPFPARNFENHESVRSLNLL